MGLARVRTLRVKSPCEHPLQCARCIRRAARHVVREGLFRREQRGAARALAVAACGATLAGCDTLSSLNPFDKGEKYKPEIVPDVPAEKLYNEGLARLQKQDYEGAAKKFADLDKQYPYSEWSRKALIMTAYANYEGGTLRGSDHGLEALPAAASGDARTPPTPIPDGMSYYNQIPTSRATRSSPSGPSQALQELSQRYPKSEYVGGREVQDPGRQRPARRQGDGGRALLSPEAQLHRRDQPLPRRRRASTRPRVTSRRRSSV